MTPLTLLQNTRALIVRGWNQGTFAQNAKGEAVTSGDPEACSWCLIGALGTAAKDHETAFDRAYDILRKLMPIGSYSLSLWNDLPGRTQADVLALIDRAIAQMTT